MAEGRNVALVLGGFEEATACSMGKDRVVVKERKGIIKYCLRYGYNIHPVYSFGEDETYYYAQGLLKFRMWLNRYKIPAIAFFGRPCLPWLPRTQAKVFTYVGDPIECPKIENPSKEDVDKWHRCYVEGLQSLFEAKKAEAGRPDAILEIM